MKENQVRDTIKAGDFLIKEGTALPETMRIKSKPCIPGWNLAWELDGRGLNREVEKAGWTFFCIAAQTRAGVFGIDREKMIRRAIGRIVKGPRLERFNSLEIADVASLGSARFPGIWHVTVSVRPRHIQQGLFLFSGKDPSEWEAGENKIPSEIAGLASSKTPALGF